MHVSPCGWFCFKSPHGWRVEDTPRSIVAFNTQARGRIELTSAMNRKTIIFDEIMEMHESMVREFPATLKETATDRTDNGLDYIVTTVSDHEYVTVITHIFWSKYCVHIRLDSPIDEHLMPEMEALDLILYSIESLTID